MTFDANAIEVVEASVSERGLIEGLLQFYVYDFSEMEPADSVEFEVQANGRFTCSALWEGYWREPSHTALIIRRGGRPAGFALLNATSHSGWEVDHNMAEFFVMRKHRRGGAGRAAVREILGRYPGRWEVAVAQRNTVARAFWPAAVAATPGVRDLIAHQGDGVSWTGPLLNFFVEG